MNKPILKRLAEQANLMPPYPDKRFPPSPYYRFLKLAAEYIKSKLSVELGVCGGGASFHMALGSEKCVGVDIINDYEDNINFILNNRDNYTFLLGDSVYLAPVVYERFGKIDLLFIDTTHTYEQTMSEYFSYERYLSGKAIVCLDDLFRPGMDLAWSEMPEPKLRLDFLHPSQSATDGGFGVVYK